jgi:hypothetical protein
MQKNAMFFCKKKDLFFIAKCRTIFLIRKGNLNALFINFGQFVFLWLYRRGVGGLFGDYALLG